MVAGAFHGLVDVAGVLVRFDHPFASGLDGLVFGFAAIAVLSAVALTAALGV